MELNLRERTFVGIPDEYYNSDFVSPFKVKYSIDNIKDFSHQAKIHKSLCLKSFFNESAYIYYLLSRSELNLNGCKIYTCADLEVNENQELALDRYSKLQVLALLDIDQPARPRFIESFLRKWLEGGKSLLIFYENDFKSLDVYSKWFTSLLSVKQER